VLPRDAMPPETILFDGHLLTQDGSCPRASALFVRGERIVAVGESSDMLSLAGAHTLRLGLEGRTVVGYARGDGRTRITADTGSGDVVVAPLARTTEKP